MKLLASYNVFDGEEFLECSISQIRASADFILILAQTVSNTGNVYQGGLNEAIRLKEKGLIDKIITYTPNAGHPFFEETAKRQLGQRFAKKNGYTHILNLDCDELFEDFAYWLNYHRPMLDHHDWTIVEIQTYFGSKNLTIGIDSTYMPFIAKTHLHLGAYPCDYLCDGTRKFNSKNYVLLPGVVMHHYSWVRKDIERKIENSTARENIKKSSLLEDYRNAKEGNYIEHYKKSLKFVKTRFDCLTSM